MSGGISSNIVVARLASLVVGGLTPFTTIDFPGRLAAVVFCQGCPWRCRYCHNPHLLSARAPAARPWFEIVDWLETRRGLLDGVVFSGGEPLLQRDLYDAITAVRAQGFAVALHTAGAYPRRLAAVLPLLDWVGFDVKAPFGEYRAVTSVDGDGNARESLALLTASGIPYEVRCTVDAQLLGDDALVRMTAQLSAMGVGRVILQTCREAAVVVPKPQRIPLNAGVKGVREHSATHQRRTKCQMRYVND